MRVIKFMKWWWDRNDQFNRVVACCIIFNFLPCAISAFWIGADLALVAAVIIFLSFIVGVVLYEISHWLRRAWNQYNEECPPDDVRIINRLKGHNSKL